MLKSEIKKEPKFTLGFVGQGWIGRNLADHFADRGFEVVRYGLEPEYKANRDRIAKCDVVFVAVPTPTTEDGFVLDNVRSALSLIGKDKIAVIKSTVLPGSTDKLSEEFPDIFVFHSPEFLREVTVRNDIDEPERNIIGVPCAHLADTKWQEQAQTVMSILPINSQVVTENIICASTEAEMIKYIGNNFLTIKLVFMNLMYDLVKHLNIDWAVVSSAVAKDPRIGFSHMQPVHQYGHMGQKEGRGAGGHCLPKDLAALRSLYEKLLPDDQMGHSLLRAIEEKNIHLLHHSGKDVDILEAIYGSGLKDLLPK